jgi:CheY-like chemotaxis protein
VEDLAGTSTKNSECTAVVAVLVVDDDPDERTLVADLIESAGFSVVTASDGREALAILRRVQPELIVLDVCMPIMDGAEFRAEQRRSRGWLRIPTVVMTGGDDEPQLDLAVEQTLHKPFRARDLIAVVKKHCTASRLH